MLKDKQYAQCLSLLPKGYFLQVGFNNKVMFQSHIVFLIHYACDLK